MKIVVARWENELDKRRLTEELSGKRPTPATEQSGDLHPLAEV
jgi:hypothetical protein